MAFRRSREVEAREEEGGRVVNALFIHANSSSVMMRMTLRGVLVGLFQVVASLPSGRPQHEPSCGHGEDISTVVDLGYSKYEGLRLEPASVNQWLGMRFAAPPTGDLRWRAPQPALMDDTEILSATRFGATCLGYWESELSDSVNEDCLYLNVFAPANATTASKLPVWFFIQGGGYAGNLDQNFNAMQVIEESGHSMRYALHWVQKYIHLFGGDPDHVVIAGDSAGAGSVAFHMAAYGGRDDKLFVGGVVESSFWPTHRKVSDMEFQFDRFAANVSCGPDEAPDGNVRTAFAQRTPPRYNQQTMPKHFRDALHLQSANAYGENTFTCPGIEISNSIAAYLSPDQVWNYRYNVEDRDTVAAGYGVPHVSEKTAIYGVNNTGPCDGCSYATYNAPMVPIVMHYWISFIKHLNPNVEKHATPPEWEPWMQRCGHAWQPQRLKFELNATEMESVPADQLERCDLWKDLAAVTEQ
ncbi:hypothetical protein KC323_g1925 [Hortaea werneckii]|nr:hypothetical protein KC323_g1925 [Hortaea werneckii]